MIVQDTDKEVMQAALQTRLLRRLQSRERLKSLAAAGPDTRTKEQRELESLRAYLKDWAACQGIFQLDKGGSGGRSALAAYMKDDSPTAGDWLEQSDGWAMAVIDTAIVDLSATLDRGREMRAALYVRWLNEGILNEEGQSLRVFRAGRLKGYTMAQVDELADRAELALIPLVKQAELPL